MSSGKTKRPTPAQIYVLRKLADGWKLVPSGGRVGNGILLKTGYRMWRRISESNVTALFSDMLIERAGDIYDPHYRITPDGLAALQQEHPNV